MSDQRNEIAPVTPLAIDDFAAFYEEIHDGTKQPFQWQLRLAADACNGKWPDYIKLPTSSGKTAVIDIAIFALAYQAHESNRVDGVVTAARRIFFVVDRRIIVNEAYNQTRRTAHKLRDAAKPDTKQPEILQRVAACLRRLAGADEAPPLDCFELRGGIYRDDAWIRSPLQPTVLTSTVDQVGSRMLFRGYGVSDRNLPIHAAMTSNDSLIILDEAHCSLPFSQTMDAIAKYRGEAWAEQPIASPFSFVQMTATPPEERGNRSLFTLNDSDYEHDALLEKRHGCKKPVALIHDANAKGKSLPAKLAKKLVEQSSALAKNHNCKKIAIVVNRVAIARATYELLEKKHPGNVSLMIGRMRPIDRDNLTTSLQEKFASGTNATWEDPKFVVATQCLEVGADLDFDGMVCQCASLDALRQRFGRLNRLGESSHASGVIVAAEGDLQPLDKLKKDKPLDPIYGNALARTWHWLMNQSDEQHVIDFGIKALDTKIATLSNDKMELAAPAPDAPVLMPSHVDMLCQTSPRPTPEPDVASYLHGVQRGMPEVRVCWRADLDMRRIVDSARSIPNAPHWCDAIEVSPPTSPECLSVPLHIFKKWLCGEKIVDTTGDVLSEQAEEENDPKPKHEVTEIRFALVWRGTRRNVAKGDAEKDISRERSFAIGVNNISAIRPNDTIVIPAQFGGWTQFGFIPDAPVEPTGISERLLESGVVSHADGCDKLAAIDVADLAFAQSRARTILRVHPHLEPNGSTRPLFERLLGEISNGEADLSIGRWKRWITENASNSEDETEANGGNGSTANSDAIRATDRTRLQRLLETSGTIVRYPGGIAWTTGLHHDRHTGIPPLPLEHFGDDNDLLSETGPLSLIQHLADVFAAASRHTTGTKLPDNLKQSITTAAKLHDIGKADSRFQAMLLGKPLSLAYMQPKLWAKSEIRGHRQANDLPLNFRHEMVSLELLNRFEANGTSDPDLLRHLVASHHGHARPLAPICVDDSAPGFRLSEFGVPTVTQEERSDWTPAHQLDSGIAERFWSLNRKYGWWGLPFLESLLRLADWTASANPNRVSADTIQFTAKISNNLLPRENRELNQVALIGIDGSNPLGFLAALGLFRSLAKPEFGIDCELAWHEMQGAWRPVIQFSDCDLCDRDALLDFLEKSLQSDVDRHPALRLFAVKGDRRDAFLKVATDANLNWRDEADWLSCNGSDAVDAEAISQLQTTRRDYHSINVRGLLTETTRQQLSRTLFKPWDYADPIAGVSLHLEPREDRRHAYQWHTPSGDPTRKVRGGMTGANRLALEAWPLFQSLPVGDRLVTVGFRGVRASDTRLTWPIWNQPISIDVVTTLLSHRAIQDVDVNANELQPLGIIRTYRCGRILVGKTPNLTSAVAAMA